MDQRPSMTFAVGDHVRIAGDHPWRGRTGTITRSFGKAGLDWIVRLDVSWGDTAVEEENLRHAPR